MDLVRYMFWVSDLPMMCKIYQTPGDNPLPVTRRSALPDGCAGG